MITLDQILEAATQDHEDLDFDRLFEFFPREDGVAPTPLTEENVLDRLQADLEFAFEKALDRMSLTSSMMYRAIKTWLWVLEEELQHCKEYSHFGLPFFKAVAIKYGFPNEIGEFRGDEEKYRGGPMNYGQTMVGTLEPVEVLVDFDGPRVFTSLAPDGAMLLAYVCDETGSRLLVVPTDRETVDDLKSGRLALLTALTLPWVWLVDRDGSLVSARRTTLGEVPPLNLPLARARLND